MLCGYIQIVRSVEFSFFFIFNTVKSLSTTIFQGGVFVNLKKKEADKLQSVLAKEMHEEVQFYEDVQMFAFGHSISTTTLTALNWKITNQIGGEAYLGNPQATDAGIITHNY